MLRNSPALKDEFVSYIVQEESNGEYTTLEPFYIELQPVIDENGMDFVVDKLRKGAASCLVVYRDSL